MTAPTITRVTLFRNTVNDISTAASFDITAEFLASVTPSSDGTTITYAGASISRTGLSPGTTYHYWMEIEDCCSNVTDQYLGTITTASSYSPDITAAVDASRTMPGVHLSLAVPEVTEIAGTISLWYKRHTNVSMGLFGTDDPTGAAWADLAAGASLLVGSDNGTRYLMLNTPGGFARMTTPDGLAWRHVIWSWNGTSSHFYVDDASPSMTASVPKGSYTKRDVEVGPWYDSTTDHSLNACLAEVYYSPEYIDLSVEANRRKFISATGVPVSLGADGSLPTGNQPDIYLSGQAANWNAGKNFGSAGDFTVNGTLTGCSSTPELWPIDINAAVDFDGTVYLSGTGTAVHSSKYLDLSVEANRRKFISATGAPVSLGADGSTPTGNQPDVYMSGAAANWNAGKNFGSAPDFTVTGALTDCASMPFVRPTTTTITPVIASSSPPDAYGTLSNILVDEGGGSRAAWFVGNSPVTVTFTYSTPIYFDNYNIELANSITDITVTLFDSSDTVLYTRVFGGNVNMNGVLVEQFGVSYATVVIRIATSNTSFYRFITSGAVV
eukprot:jgi/Tetstr1/420466/TSEL_011579.t1